MHWVRCIVHSRMHAQQYVYHQAEAAVQQTRAAASGQIYNMKRPPWQQQHHTDEIAADNASLWSDNARPNAGIPEPHMQRHDATTNTTADNEYRLRIVAAASAEGTAATSNEENAKQTLQWQNEHIAAQMQ